MNRKIGLFIFFIFLLGTAGFFLGKNTNGRKQPLVNSEENEKIQITASFYPVAEFSQQVGGNNVIVHNLTLPGSEPHDFDPTPQDLVAIENANLLVYNGAGLELWLDKLNPDLKQKKPMINVSEGISLLDSNEEGTRKDPHIWLDPVLAIQQVRNIQNGLISVDPRHKEYYLQNSNEYIKKLNDLDTEFRNGLAQCERHEIITSHNAFQYLGKRYGLNVLSISGLSPDEEPTPKKLAEVVQFSQQHQVKYIFFESLVSPKLSETIAHETGAQAISFNPIEGLTTEQINQGKNYVTVQKENLAALRTALGCK